MRRSAARATIDLTAYDLYLRAVGLFSNNERADFSESGIA